MFRYQDDYKKICETLGYKFNNKNLLLQALTRRSALNEGRQNAEIGDYQRLEFLGDKILNLVVSDILMEQHPGWREGQLTQETAKYVNNNGPLAMVARNLNWGKFIIMGHGEESSNHARDNDKVLSDAIEALVGALWLDSKRNYPFLKEFIIKHWGPLGLMPTAEYCELEDIILDSDISFSKKLQTLKSFFDKSFTKDTLHRSIELVLDYPEMLKIALQKSADKEFLDKMLIQCVEWGQAKQVKLLLQAGANANQVVGVESLLQKAATSHFADSPLIVEALLQHKADPDWRRGKYQYKSIQDSNFSSSILILSKLKSKMAAKIEIIEYEDLSTALHQVVQDDNVPNPEAQKQIVRNLLKYDANPNLVDENKKTPLHLICELFYLTQANYDIIHELVLAKADINLIDGEGNTPLHLLLLHYGIGSFDSEFKIIDAVKIILKAGAQINIQNKNGDTPLHLVYKLLAKFKSLPNIAYVCLRITEKLLSKGANMQIKNEQGITSELLNKNIKISEEVANKLGFSFLTNKELQKEPDDLQDNYKKKFS